MGRAPGAAGSHVQHARIAFGISDKFSNVLSWDRWVHHHDKCPTSKARYRGDHPDTATDLSNLARVLGKIGYIEQAEAVFERAIAIGEKTRGQGHPLTQRFCSNYARLLFDTGRAIEALSPAQAALAVHETTPGPNHTWTKDSAGVVADALEALNRGDEAAALRARHAIEY